MYYSLFKKKLLRDDNQIMKYLPKNAFGIFSTIRRSHKIQTYPLDIHGCIGYWDNNFTILSKPNLYNNGLRVSYDSVWNDNRNRYFEPIQNDPNSFLELDFMMKPIYTINKENGFIKTLNEIFTNKIYGIIIQSKDKTSKATYLPNIFPNISWTKMLNSIKEKANIQTDDFELFAYKIIQIKSKFITLLTYENFSYNSIYNFSRFLINNMNVKLSFPFVYSCKDTILQWNQTDQVRNISTLSLMYKLIDLYPTIFTKTDVENIKKNILNIVHNIDQYSSQSLSFLGYIYGMFNNSKDKVVFCKKLMNDFPNAENDFEKPEIFIGLVQAGCRRPNYELTYDSNDTIFKMNWIIQAIISIQKKPSKQLIYILEDKIQTIIMNIKNTETNYIAVAFESLCFVSCSISTNKSRCLHTLFQLLFELENRKTCHPNLYAFLDKTTSRVDITGHVNNGLFQLVKNMYI